MADKDQAQKQKSVPMRTCIVTREKLPKRELIRLVRVATEDGAYAVAIDLYNKLSGRGANIKPEVEVFEKAIGKGILANALQLGRPLGKSEQEQLRNDFIDALEERAFRPKNQKVRLKVSRKDFQEKLAN